MLISIDHGNSEMKTIHKAFPSGLVCNPSMPQMAEDWLELDGNAYVLTGRHLPYRRDKTQNGDYYILTLFAIAKELALAGLREADIKLAVGLPPAHMQQLKQAFSDYLVRDRREVKYCHNGQDYKIRITGTYIFPQAYPAIYEKYSEAAAFDKAYIVDIGGYTTDVLMIRRGKLDLSCCYSLESGVIKLFNRAASLLTSGFGGTFDESDIKGVLQGKETLLDEDMRKTINRAAALHTEAMLDSLRADDIDLSYTPSFFVGGGSLLLKPFLEKTGRLASKTQFISDTLANAKGYEAMATALLSEGNGGNA